MVWTESLKWLELGLVFGSLWARMKVGRAFNNYGLILAVFLELFRQGLMLEAH